MSDSMDHAAFWNAYHRTRALPADLPDEAKTAVFREHFIGVDEKPTSPDAHVAVARLIGNMRLRGELR